MAAPLIIQSLLKKRHRWAITHPSFIGHAAGLAVVLPAVILACSFPGWPLAVAALLWGNLCADDACPGRSVRSNVDEQGFPERHRPPRIHSIAAAKKRTGHALG